MVGRLVDRSLVTMERGDDGAGRYGLLDSVRTYARDRLDQSGDVGPPELQVAGSLLLGWLHAAAGDADPGHAAVLHAIEQLAGVDDDHARGRADLFLAYVLSPKGEFDEALRLLDRARHVFSVLGRRWDEATTWVLTAHVTLAAGDQSAAVDACAEATQLLHDVGDPWLLVHVESMLGAVAQAEQRYADACEHLARAAAASRQQGFAASHAYHLANLGRAQPQHGDLDTAAHALQQAIDTAPATGDLRVTALAHRSADAGDLAAATAQLALADASMPAARLRVTKDDRIDALETRRLIG